MLGIFKIKHIFKRPVYAGLYEYLKGADKIRLCKYANGHLLRTETVFTTKLDFMLAKGDSLYVVDKDEKINVVDVSIGDDGNVYCWLEPEFDTDNDITKDSLEKCKKEQEKYQE